MPPAHVACLEMLEPVMTMREGARIYAPGGRLLRPGEPLEPAGARRRRSSCVAEEGGARASTRDRSRESLLGLIAERGGLVTRGDLAAYEALWAEPVEVAYAGRAVPHARRACAGVAPALERLPPLAGLDEPARTLALLDALDGAPDAAAHTTNLVTVDAEGSACVLTTSLGLGSGDFLPGLDLHLNSMLGEVDLLVGRSSRARGCRA